MKQVTAEIIHQSWKENFGRHIFLFNFAVLQGKIQKGLSKL